MGLLSSIRNLLRKTKPETGQDERAGAGSPASSADGRVQRTCKSCGKTFTVDPSLQYVPNFCKSCKKRFAQEKEEKQRAGAPRKIRRKCKACGNYFTFPNTLEHYPNYCPNCRKQHKAEMKARYSRKKDPGE